MKPKETENVDFKEEIASLFRAKSEESASTWLQCADNYGPLDRRCNAETALSRAKSALRSLAVTSARKPGKQTFLDNIDAASVDNWKPHLRKAVNYAVTSKLI